MLSAHRTPEQVPEWSSTAEQRGLEVLIAAAGGAAHLPGVVAAKTVLPVLGVPVASTTLGGADALLAIVQMPKGIPVGTWPSASAGAGNAALLAIAILAGKRPELRDKLRAWRKGRGGRGFEGGQGGTGHFRGAGACAGLLTLPHRQPSRSGIWWRGSGRPAPGPG